MKLISASCYMAAKTRTTPGKVYGAARACAPEGTVAMDYLATAVERALDRAKCSAVELDLIVSLSWSPDHLVADAMIMGPRIGHPLQKKIGASNAFVFDLMDASLAKALHVVNQFAQGQSLQRILLVRADIGQGLHPDPRSGFTIPDGAFALLLEPDAQQLFFSTEISDGFQPLRVDLNTQISSAADAKGTLCFPPQPELDAAISHAVQSLNSAAGFAPANVLREFWLSHETSRPHCLGPFDLAFQLEMCMEFQCEPIFATSFDPFSLRVEGVTLTVAGGSYDGC